MSLVASHWIEECRSRVSVVSIATVTDQSDIDEEKSYERIHPRPAPKAAKDGGGRGRERGG